MHGRPSLQDLYVGCLAALADAMDPEAAGLPECQGEALALLVQWGAGNAPTREAVWAHNMEIARRRAHCHGRRSSFAAGERFRRRVLVLDPDMRTFLYRYFIALRGEFADVIDVALALDASRFGGREQLCVAAMNLDSGMCAWAPTQVIPTKK